MISILRKNIALVACLFIVGAATAQSDVHIVKVSFPENVMAEVWVNKGTRQKFQRIAEFNVNSAKRNFAFAIPKDSATEYLCQINFMEPGGHHPKMTGVSVIPLSLNPDKDYSLSITSSKIDPDKKKGWELKEGETKNSLTLITGRVQRAMMPSPISLQSVDNGTTVSVGSFLPNKVGEFAIPYQVTKAGFYYLTSSRWHVRIYLDPSDKLDLNVDNMTGNIVSLNGSPVNQLLNKWQQLITPITSYGYNLVLYKDSVNLDEYINTYKKLQPAIEEFSKSLNIKDPGVLRAMKNAINVDRELAPLNLLFYLSAKKVRGFRMRPQDFNVVPASYQEFIQQSKFSSASILAVGEARQYVNLYAKLNLALIPEEKRAQLTTAERLKLMSNSIANDTLKAYFLKDQIEALTINNLSELRATFEPFMKYTQREPLKSVYNSRLGLFIGDTAFVGKSSYNFSVPDSSGRMVSMKDFKGKVILIDVWATWCGPCRGEIPFLKAIEEEYRNNKDIVFMGISTDQASSRQKWIDVMKKENLQGIQLLDDAGKLFARKHQIMAIPRFMLIDKQGKWIEIRCPLPSDKENLKKYLDRALQQNQISKK